MRIPRSILLLSALHEVHARTSISASHAHKRGDGYDAPTDTIDPAASDHDHDFHTFVTRPDIVAPRWDITTYDEQALAPGYWLVATYEDAHQRERGDAWVGPHIYDGEGDLIWSGAPAFNGFDVFGFTKRQFEGQDMLSMVYRHEFGAILDNKYQIHKKAYVEPDVDFNMHEFNVVDNATRLLLMRMKTKRTSREISAEVGYDGKCNVRFNGFEERDSETLEPTFTWLAEGIIPLDESMLDNVPFKYLCNDDNGWDYVHCNSIDKFSDGDFLLGCRHTDTVYKISHKDGSIVWRLGGRNNDFEFDLDLEHGGLTNPGFHFSGQHDVKVQMSNETHSIISMLDNASRPGRHEQSNDFSRGLLIEVRADGMRARIIQEYPHPQGEFARGRGSFQLLPNGNVFCGFFEHTFIAEYAHDGTVLMEAKVRPNTKSYRSYKFPWVGYPMLPPDVYSVAFAKDGEDTYSTIVYISWNGATEVDTWNIYQAHAIGTRQLMVSTPKTGFETAITYDGYASHVTVEAVDRTGKILGTSEVTKTVGPAALIEGLDVQEVEWIEDDISAVSTFLEHPIVAFLLGIAFCGTVCLTVWGIRRWRGRKCWAGWARPIASWTRTAPMYDRLLQQNVNDGDIALDEDDLRVPGQNG
ncbi:hypothetical protein LTR37_009425 [Vermiconidia calcicola]|uniref:Uncharacterized protein n=1 Tax=Vermiconidia calcicola TaxID=1690605 RepID=A0ACC3N9M1_9PEZI|nr:hypothetical protein LTR37_009425 [Vermiconidia calcicola]